ncbi:hypothetical protein Gotur_003148, partial [Gossypium turneri]
MDLLSQSVDTSSTLPLGLVSSSPQSILGYYYPEIGSWDWILHQEGIPVMGIIPHM